MNKKNNYKVVDEKGKIVAKFRLKIAAEQNLPRLKINKREVLEIKAI